MARQLPVMGFDYGAVVHVETGDEIPYAFIGVLQEDQGAAPGGATGIEDIYYKTLLQGTGY